MKQRGRAKAHGSMGVMATSMHDARPPRGEGDARLFEDRQGVDISTDRDLAIGSPRCSDDVDHGPRAGRGSRFADALFLEPAHDKWLGFALLVRELGMRMKMPSGGNHRIVQREDEG